MIDSLFDHDESSLMLITFGMVDKDSEPAKQMQENQTNIMPL